MTPEQIQQAIEGILSIQRGLQDGQLNQETRLERMETNITSMVQAVQRMTDVQLQTFRVIEEMQAEVRGLQTENRRILDHLFGEA